MDSDLQYLVHFFNDRQHLFRTLTMAGAARVDDICDRVAATKGWFWGRFAPSGRRAYWNRRLFVERELYEGYTKCYGILKEKIPVYFYLYPGITQQGILDLARQRTNHEETEPHVVVVKIEDLADTTNMTFTLNDSFASYWKKAVEAGLEIRGDRGDHIVLPDHNQVFPFSMLEQVHQKYKGGKISYEVQVWDHELLEKMRYTILERYKA